MTIRPFDLARLVRVSAAERDVVRRATARMGSLDQRRELQLAPFGSVSLKYVEVTAPVQPEPSDAVWELSRAGQGTSHAYLILDGLCALRIVATTLGLPGPRVFRPLGAAERGIVTAAIAALLRTAKCDAMVTLGTRQWRAVGLARLVVAVDLGASHERVRLDLPAEWIPSASHAAFVVESTRRGLGIPLTLEIGRTILTVRDWSRVQSGDAVVFDGHGALDSTHDWQARMVCGGFGSDAVIAPDGCVKITSWFQPENDDGAEREDTGVLSKRGRQIMAIDDPQTVSSTMLAAAPIEVVAEVGRLVLRADEVTALKPGSILSLGPLRPTTVGLRVGNRCWAQGELVDVDGELGVRLTTLATARETWTQGRVESRLGETRIEGQADPQATTRAAVRVDVRGETPTAAQAETDKTLPGADTVR
jgi:type III secretion system YscQ/HrcQ family protein